MSGWNDSVVNEFRSNGGKVAGFESQPLLLLHHRGARTGTPRVSPLAYLEIADGYAVFASKGGAHTNPDWLYNVKANPDVTIEVGSQTVAVRARVAEEAERIEIWARQTAFNPVFARYEEKTSRDHIPVVVLESRSS